MWNAKNKRTRETETDSEMQRTFRRFPDRRGAEGLGTRRQDQVRCGSYRNKGSAIVRGTDGETYRGRHVARCIDV